MGVWYESRLHKTANETSFGRRVLSMRPYHPYQLELNSKVSRAFPRWLEGLLPLSLIMKRIVVILFRKGGTS